MAVRITHHDDGRPETRPHALQQQLDRCRAGVEPAEALPAYARDWLVAELHDRGWTDLEIAAHTRMTTYTTARIRGRLGLPPNQMRGAVA